MNNFFSTKQLIPTPLWWRVLKRIQKTYCSHPDKHRSVWNSGLEQCRYCAHVFIEKVKPIDYGKESNNNRTTVKA